MKNKIVLGDNYLSNSIDVLCTMVITKKSYDEFSSLISLCGRLRKLSFWAGHQLNCSTEANL